MPRRPQGDGRRSLSSVRRWLQDAKRAGARRSGQHRLEEVLRRVEQSLDEKDAALIRAVFESYAYVTELVEDKNTSIRRLRQLFFGTRTEKTDAVVGAKTEESDAASDAAAAAETGSAAGEPEPRRIERIRAGDCLEGSRAQRRRRLPGCRAD